MPSFLFDRSISPLIILAITHINPVLNRQCTVINHQLRHTVQEKSIAHSIFLRMLVTTINPVAHGLIHPLNINLRKRESSPSSNTFQHSL